MKYLDLTGLQKLWAKIKALVDTKVSADEVKGIYLTGENRTIVGAESDVGIIWEGDGTLFKDENAITEITNTHFMTRVPIVAGNNVTFETDTENQVVKINSTGGGSSSCNIIDLGTQESHKVAQQAMVDYVISQSAENDCYLFKYWCSCYNNACFAVVYNWGTDDEIYVEGTVYDNQSSYRRFLYKNGEFTFDGCWLNIASWDEERSNLDTENKNVIAAINEINAKVGSSSGGTPTKIENGDSYVKIDANGYIDVTTPTGNDEMIRMTSEIIEINANSSNGYLELNSPSGSITMSSPEVNIDGGDVYIGQYYIEGGDPVDNFYVRSSGAVDITGNEIVIEEPGSGSRLLLESNGDVTLHADYHLTLHGSYDDSGIDFDMSSDGTTINNPNGIHLIGDGGNVVIETADEGTIELATPNFSVFTRGTYGTAGQVLMSDGTYAYWGDVEGSSGGGSPLYLHEYYLMGTHPDTNEEFGVSLQFLSTSVDPVAENPHQLARAYAENKIIYVDGQGKKYSADEEKYQILITSVGVESSEWYFDLYLIPIAGGETLYSGGGDNYWLNSIDEITIGQFTEGVGGSSGGGATLSMPRIRLANYRYDEPVFYYDESGEWEGKITFSVHIQDGTVQIGDQLQICKMGKTYNKNKLQVFMQKTITAEDIENLAKQPYLQITTDDFAGNTHGADTSDVFERLNRTDTFEINRKKPKYIRIRRPLYKGDRVVNAIFSNVVPVEFGLKFEKIYTE